MGLSPAVEVPLVPYFGLDGGMELQQEEGPRLLSRGRGPQDPRARVR